MRKINEAWIKKWLGKVRVQAEIESAILKLGREPKDTVELQSQINKARQLAEEEINAELVEEYGRDHKGIAFIKNLERELRLPELG